MKLHEVDIIVDVREHEEFDEGHLRGAIHIPLFRLTQMPETLTDDQYAIIGVYCDTGYRSRIAAIYLASVGLMVEDLGRMINI